MAIAQPRAPRHIIYIVSVLVGAALAACTEREPDERAAQTPSNRDSDPAVAGSGDVAGHPSPSPAPPTQTPAKGSPTIAPGASQPADPRSAPGPSTMTPGELPSTPATTDSESGFHLDDPEVEYEIPRRRSRPSKGRTIQIVLRSSPPGAVAAVDGVAVGPTPTLWEGAVDATSREFTFVLPGYAIARYRFVPTRSGIVHGTLEPIKAEGEDGDPRDRRRLRARPQAQPGPATK